MSTPTSRGLNSATIPFTSSSLSSPVRSRRIDRKRTLLSPERAIDALVRLRRHLSKEDLLRLIPATKHRGSYIAGLATAPAADEELVLYALDTSRTITLKIALANHPKFRLLPSVRRRLLDSMERSITHGAQHHPGVACYVPGP